MDERLPTHQPPQRNVLPPRSTQTAVTQLKRRRRRGRRQGLAALAFLAPWLVGLTVFYGYPLVMTVYYGLTDFDGVNFPPRFIGLDNYRELFSEDPRFWTSVRNTAWWVAISVPALLILGFALAVALNARVKGQAFFRAAIYLPSTIPAVGATLLFLWLLNPTGGVVNGALGIFGIEGPGWFSSPSWSKPSLLLLALWGVGGLMVIFLAALQHVPQHLYDAAAIDGAGPLRRLFTITVPTVAPAGFFNAILALVASFTYFAQPLIASSAPPGLGGGLALGGGTLSGGGGGIGGPVDSSLMYSLYIYDQLFTHFRFGYAAAMSTMLAVTVMGLGTAIFLIGRRFTGGRRL